ncbi:hypothetical protein FA15DRAFT_759705 [Coprinopsis marcescibilis]|uniref:Uncharacterized protein n=1 Tax=Coprinopsis marcescibilis TaxID=230819 RepID=A0A5C3KJ55_COPMA|nr:hypothetical protein FA15DRAFT_759705 [Coprinopsis marcescibilis]
MKLLNFCITGEESPMKEFSKLDTIMGQVMANKIDMPEYVTTLMVLRTLPKKFEVVAQTFLQENQTMDDATLDKLKKKVILEWERLSKPKALANRISTVKPKGQNPTYANQKGSSHRPFHQKQQSQPSTSSAPPPANTGNQQQQPFKKKKRGGQKVKARIAAAQLAAAAYSSITTDDSTMDIDTPMLPVPQNPPPPQQAIHSTLEIGKSGKAVTRHARSDMPSHTYSQGATARKWVDQLVGKETQSPYSAYQSARDLCDSLGAPKTAETIRRLEELIEYQHSTNEPIWEIQTPTGARKWSVSPARSDDGCYHTAKKSLIDRITVSDTEEPKRELYVSNIYSDDEDMVSLGDPKEDTRLSSCPPTPRFSQEPEDPSWTNEQRDEWWNRQEDARYQAYLRGDDPTM